VSTIAFQCDGASPGVFKFIAELEDATRREIRDDNGHAKPPKEIFGKINCKPAS
jgi:hypothetical protein